MANEKNEFRLDIGRRIQQAREKTGMTQEQLARQLGKTSQFVSTMERGVSGPSLEMVVKLCDILNVSADEILRGKGDSCGADYIAWKLSKLSENELRYVDKMMDALLALVDEQAVERQ